MPRMSPNVPSPASTSSLSFSDESLKHFTSDCTVVGTHKLHYQPHQQWDFFTDTEGRPIDLSLMLPHYRAHNQPTGHRMSMHIRSQSGEIKAKICRKSPRSPFFLSVESSSAAPITLYLPSDFAGVIRLPAHSPRAYAPKQKVSFSAGFTNHILPHARFTSSTQMRKLYHDNDQYDDEEDGPDEVEVCALGPVTFRMWDVFEGAPESAARETWRRMCRRASSKNLRGEAKSRQRLHAIDWDFLLED